MQTVPRKCAIPTGNAVTSHYARNWYRPMRQHSGIGVLDKAMGVLHAVAEEPCSLTELCARTGLPRATAHRLAVGLEVHRLLTRDSDGQWCPGPGLAELAATANDPLIAAAGLILPRLREITGESVQLYRREGTQRICVASMEPPTGLRDTVLVGARLPMNAGSGAKVLLAWQIHKPNGPSSPMRRSANECSSRFAGAAGHRARPNVSPVSPASRLPSETRQALSLPRFRSPAPSIGWVDDREPAGRRTFSQLPKRSTSVCNS